MDDAELDREIEAVRERLYALYRERRTRREAAAALLRKPRPPAPELVFQCALIGLSHDAIATKFAIKPQKVRELLRDHIWSQSYRNGDRHEQWQAEYKRGLALNDTLPPGSRLRRRSLWPWTDSMYDGVRYDDAQWN